MTRKQTADHAGSIHLTVHDLTDDGLVRVARAYRRQIEDKTADAVNHPKRYQRQLADIRSEQLSRFRLTMRYGAVDNHLGTRTYDRWLRHGEAPTYTLAIWMDYAKWFTGQSSVLNWDSLCPDKALSRGPLFETVSAAGGGVEIVVKLPEGFIMPRHRKCS